MDNIPEHGGFIVAAKHQSTWETHTILLFIKDPSYILKRELMFIPFFGWFAWKMNVIDVNRGRKGVALRDMTGKAKAQLADARQIVIYPEGTRKMVNADPTYKYGVTHMYTSLDARVLPVALNAGLSWPRNSWRLYKGTCVLEFLPMIEPGLEKEKFAEKMESLIEAKTNELVTHGISEIEYDGPAT